MSRVHLVVKYELLRPDAQIKIWNQFVDKLDRERADFVVDQRATRYIEGYFRTAKIAWNGREIRNGMSSFICFHTLSKRAQQSKQLWQ